MHCFLSGVDPSQIRLVVDERPYFVVGGCFTVFGVIYGLAAGVIHLHASYNGLMYLILDLMFFQVCLLLPGIGLCSGIGLGIWEGLALIELHHLRPHRNRTKWLVKGLLFLFGLGDVFLGLAFCYVADWVANQRSMWKFGREPWQNFFVYGGLLQSVSGIYRMLFVLFCGLKSKVAMRVGCYFMFVSGISMAAAVLGVPSYYMIEYEHFKRFVEPEMEAEAAAKAKAEAEEAAAAAAELERRAEEGELNSSERNSSPAEQSEEGESETGSGTGSETKSLSESKGSCNSNESRWCYEEDDVIPERNSRLDIEMGNLNLEKN